MRGECKKNNEQKYAEFVGLWKIYSKSQIKKKVKISERRFELFLARVVSETLVENDMCTVMEPKEPYYENEDDYIDRGQSKWPKKYQNSPIKEAELTDVQLAIIEYKNTHKWKK